MQISVLQGNLVNIKHYINSCLDDRIKKTNNLKTEKPSFYCNFALLYTDFSHIKCTDFSQSCI